MTTIEKIKAKIDYYLKNNEFGMEYRNDIKNIIDKYASEECDRDCEHCAYLECPKDERLDEEYEKYENWVSDERMDFPKTFDEFAEQYGIVDTDEIYTNGSKLIPVFRVKQWLAEQEPCDTIAYNDDFATALEKISKYEDRKESTE